MNLTPLAIILLSHMVTHRPPGKSPYSFESIQECGLSSENPECQIEPVCKEKAFWCSPPRWSEARNSWVKVETKESAIIRYAGLAEDLAFTSRYITRCIDETGLANESCERAPWWRGAQDLALVGTVIAVFESGLAEGVQGGHPPLGIGNDGEICMMGIIPQYAPMYATWLPRDERKKLTNSSFQDLNEWAKRDLHGSKNVRHCMEISLRQLVRHRAACKSDYGMFSGYAGGRCNLTDKTVGMRYSFLNTIRRRTPKLPEWVSNIINDKPKSN